MLNAMLLVPNTPWTLRLAGSMEMPLATASTGAATSTRPAPLTRTVPVSARAMPYSALITSPAPQPIRP